MMVEGVGVIEGYARSGAVQYPGYVIVRVVDGRPGSFVGGVAYLEVGGNRYRGRVLRMHGKHSVIVRFHRNIPGQAIGSRVKLAK